MATTQQPQGKKKYQDNYPSGIFRLKIVDNTLGKNERNGNMFVLLNCDVIGIKKGGNGTTLIFPSRRKVKLHCTTAAMPYSKKFIDAAGFKGDPKRLHHAHPEHVSLKGFEFDATNEPRRGEDGKLWDNFSALPVGDSNKWLENVKSMDEVDLANFDNLFGSATSPAPQQSQGSNDTQEQSVKSPW